MWPDDYIDWALQARPDVLTVVHGALDVLLTRAAPRLRRAIPELSDRATRAAFRQAYRLRHYPEYFRDRAEFRRWLGVVAIRQAIRLLLRRRLVGRALNLLPGDQRRVLGMIYLDQLSYGDVAAVLQIPAEQVHQRAAAALQALRQLL